MKNWLPCIVLACLALSCGSDKSTSLTIAAASSLRPALIELSAGFTEANGTPVSLIFSSSGKLTAQIKAGAPYDVFLSADESYPASLSAVGLTTGQPAVYAHGPLVLFSATEGIPTAPDSLQSARIKSIALANPAVAPYGRAAAEWIQRRYGDSIRKKLVYGESVGQVNQFITTKTVEIGFTAKPSLFTYEEYGIGTELNDAPPIPQAGIVLAGSEHAATARAFLAYLTSPAGSATLRKFGYLTD